MARINPDTLNYECEVIHPLPTGPDWKHFTFHGDNLIMAKEHMEHVMNHQGITEVRFRRVGTSMWRTIKH